jgi:hypothetical protein
MGVTRATRSRFAIASEDVLEFDPQRLDIGFWLPHEDIRNHLGPVITRRPALNQP